MKKFRISSILLVSFIFFQCSTNVLASDIKNDETLINKVEIIVDNAEIIIDNAGEMIDSAETMVGNVDLEIDKDVIIDKAQELYDKYGDEIPEEPEKAFYEYAVDILKEFFHNIIKFIVDFFSGLFS